MKVEKLSYAEFFNRWESEYNWTREKIRSEGRASYARHKSQRQIDARNQRIRRNQDPEKLEAYRRYCREKASKRVNTDLEFLIRKRARGRIIEAIKRGNGEKAFKTMELLGCSIPELKTHIESQFKEGMTWENHGRNGWHIDHIKPCDSFDLTDPEQQKICFHYTNLQPLWALDNWRKGNKV